MRVNLRAHAIPSQFESKSRVILRISPSRPVPGDYTCSHDGDRLMKMLRKNTDLPTSVLERFKSEMCRPSGGRLLGVDLDDQALKEVGYFID